MKLTVLGCWAPYPRANGACSGYLIQEKGVNILIDCGNGSFAKLQQHFDFRQLDAVIITHLHADHYMDLFCLVHAIRGSIRDGSRQLPLNIYLPDSPREAFNMVSKYDREFNITTYDKLPVAGGIKQLQLGALKINFTATKHPISTYAVSIEGDSKFVYSADTAWDEALISFIEGADLFLCEASLVDEDIEYARFGHLTAGQAARLAELAGAKKLILTHLWPEYNLENLLTEAGREYQGMFELATHGEIFIIERRIICPE